MVPRTGGPRIVGSGAWPKQEAGVVRGPEKTWDLAAGREDAAGRAAPSLGIHETLLRSWGQALEAQGDRAFPGHGKCHTGASRRKPFW